MKHDLYRHYDTDENLLYIGRTVRGVKRANEHARDKSWWDEVVVTRYEKFDSLAELKEAEKKAIREENPLYNKQRYRLTTVKTHTRLTRQKKRLVSSGVYKKECINSLYVTYFSLGEDQKSVRSGLLAQIAYPVVTRIQPMQPGQFKQFAVKVLGPTTPYYDGEKTVRGWTGVVHTTNLHEAEIALKEMEDARTTP
jgi:hypothetical protein